MALIIGLLSLGVVAVIIKDFTQSGSQGPAVISGVGSDISNFYTAIAGTSSGK